MHGLIRDKWAALGWENSFLGFPRTDEVGVAGHARASTFDRGTVVWSPTTGAHEVHGMIFSRWRALGRESDSISVPVATLETPVLLQFGKAKEFALHRAVYHLLDADQLIGSNVTFTWTRQ